MMLRMRLAGCLRIILLCVAIYTSSTSSTSTVSSQQVSTTVEKGERRCESVVTEPCARLYTYTQLPNLYGQISSSEASKSVNDTLNSFSLHSRPFVTFICTLYLPPCSENKSEEFELRASTFLILPCRKMCEMAFEEAQKLLTDGDSSWPVRCQTLPTENCFNSVGLDSVAFVKTTISASPTRNINNNVAKFAPLDVELGNDEGYEIEVVSSSTNHIPERRYDIANLGDPDLYHGWTDVQATGAANDYCRVIGKARRRFLSCNLAGSIGQGHHYVSKLGFEPGYPHTWFMRDMDDDGRDDYCRCVGPKNNSRITCMKAGEYGFYGSPTQGGEQHTFSLPNSGGCFNKRINPAFGEIIV